MISPASNFLFLLLILEEPTRHYLLELLQENNFSPMVFANPGQVVQAVKGQPGATVFVDCEAVSTFGTSIYSKVKVACPRCRLVLFGDRRNKAHREIVKEAMELGIYACLLAPYEDWEVLSLVKHYPRLETPKKQKGH